MIARQTALDEPGVSQVAVHQPALAVPGYDTAKEHAYVDWYEAAITAGRQAEALLAVPKGSRIEPGRATPSSRPAGPRAEADMA